jgi:signal transduction histidine kinase
VEIGFGVISMLVILLFYLNLKKSKSKNQELLILNQKVNTQKSDLERLNNTLEKINQNKSFLIQSVAHDLRTPIGNVMSLNSLQMEHLDKSKESLDFQELIESSCLLSLNIIEDILDQSMIERGKLKLKIAPYEIQKVILETRSLLLFKSNPKKISITTEFDSPMTINIDSERIKRVLINILVNAIKFSPSNSTIKIFQWTEKTSCFISISDQGIGMSKEILAHIFEKNTKSAREGLQKEQTIGIGLSITKSIIEEHGGSIKVESTPDSGSTFYIELPISISL